MPDRRHTYETTLTFGTDGEADYSEIDVTVSFTVSPGCAASMAGPAEDPEVTDIRLEQVGGRKAPWGFHTWSDKHFAELVVERLEGSERDLEAMLESAAESEAGDYDAAMDRRWEDRMGRAA